LVRTMSDDTHDAVCRICQGEGADSRPLRHPCRCTGSIKFVHEDCLQMWIHSKGSASASGNCEVCGEALHWTRQYRSDAPITITTKVVFIGASATASKILFAFVVLVLQAVAYAVMPTLVAAIAIWWSIKTLFPGTVNTALLRRNWQELVVAGWVLQRCLSLLLTNPGITGFFSSIMEVTILLPVPTGGGPHNALCPHCRQ
jgi:E3 ubiquitin-protein ligase DOA10